MTTGFEELNTPIIIGSDHAAYDLKAAIVNCLKECGFDVEDVGTHSTDSVNYADFGKIVASAVSTGKNQRGILICGTGLGMSIIANRFSGVRAALCSEPFSARMSRLHNDSNILVMGARIIGEAMALDLVNTWLKTPFEGGRHIDRLKSLEL